ncbi:MAG: hypothetical protein KHY77_03000 [Butyricicoccus pullicaecorum]|nr:hypothetical protein [Butyricicoccus pullicaecorum]
MELDRLKQHIRTRLEPFVPRIARYKYALIILLVGILLLYAGGGARDKPEQSEPRMEGTEQAFALDSFEMRLEKKLSQIAGIGRVTLMLSLEESGQSVYASNIRQTDNGQQNGSYESTLSTVSDGSYGEQPVRIKETCPTFRGAVVLCDGAQDSRVRLAVTEAIRAVCGLRTDRISVIQMEQQ